MEFSKYNDGVHWFISDTALRVVVESRTASDRYHLGKIVLQSLKDGPDYILQTDAATGELETASSVLKRSVRCAVAMKKLGLVRGDVVVLMAPHHLDLCIPFYASLYLGLTLSAIDTELGVLELKSAFGLIQPKLIFCQSNRAPNVQQALGELGSSAQVVTFDNGNQCNHFGEFLERYGDNADVDSFRAEDFDPAETISLMAPTSGTTGLRKFVATTHKGLAINTPYYFASIVDYPPRTKKCLVISPLHLLTEMITYLHSPILRYTRIQSSANMTQEHMFYVINTYKPNFMLINPTMMTTLIRLRSREKCDFTCFEVIMIGGSAVPQSLVEDVKKITPKTETYNVYGMSEVCTLAFNPVTEAPGSSGKPLGCFQYRLVDMATQRDILEPRVTGELWIKGPGIFKGYYNNPEATKATFADGGWFKTGDLFYRDDNWNYYFVERAKHLIKYYNHQVSPSEIEQLIHQDPRVREVVVTGMPGPMFGELPLTSFVKNHGESVTAQDIKDIVKDDLTYS
ncbi:hypothetical protein ACJJTC_001582 [Scirpophaga incertulas]